MKKLICMILICSSLCFTASADTSKPVRIIASDYPNLQAAVNALPNRTGEVYLPAGTYILDKTLNLSYPPGGYQGGIKLAGAGRMTKIIARTKGMPAIDLTGANHCIIQDLNIEAEPGANVKIKDAPNIGLLLARNTEGGTSQEHRFTNIIINGYFTLANVYSITSELNRFIGCIFINKAPGSHNFIWSSDNFANIRSPFQGNIKTLFSNTELRIIGCSFYNWGRGINGSNIHMRGFTMDASVRDCYMNPPASGYAVWLGPSSKGGPVESMLIDSIRVEGENSKDIFRLERSHSRITISNCSVIYGEGMALNADRVNYLTFKNNYVWNVRGWKTALRTEFLSNSNIEGNIFKFDNWGGKNPQQGQAKVIRGVRSSGSYIQVTDRREADFKSMNRTIIDALDDGEPPPSLGGKIASVLGNNTGVRRQYMGNFASGVTLNMTPVDTSTFKGMILGDIALDDGTNTQSGKPGLAVYDGKEWIPMN
ncbi:MAG: hypothetical protein GY749_41955 [Desulfobacteraceae bacterium]|nr:hypothetical protein [Desulfobacteraceae bacterium]